MQLRWFALSCSRLGRAAVLAVSTLAANFTRAQTTVTFSATADAAIGSGFSTQANGGTNQFTAFDHDFTNIQNGLVLFDLSSLSGVTITSASLHLTTTTDVPTSGFTSGNLGQTVNGATFVWRVTEGWTESQVTWLNRTTGVGWTQGAGGSFVGSASQVYNANGTGAFATNTNQLGADIEAGLSFNVTSLVQGWLDGTYTNYGLALTPTGQDTQLEFFSREFDVANPTYVNFPVGPQLVITYNAIPEPASAAGVLASIAILAGVARKKFRLRAAARA